MTQLPFIKEIEWCNERISDIVNTANVLYQKYISGENFSARKQCLDFKRMELECSKYNDRIQKLKMKEEDTHEKSDKTD